MLWANKLRHKLHLEWMKVTRDEKTFNKWQRHHRTDWETRRKALLESILLHYRNLLEFR
jgi:hypothetical protein